MNCDRLKIRDRFAELLSFLGVFYGRFVRALGDADRQCGDRDASAVEDLHRLQKAFALVAEPVFVRHVAILENDRRRFGRTHTELVFLLVRAKTVHRFVKDECRNAAIAFFLVGDGNGDQRVAGDGVRDEIL